MSNVERTKEFRKILGNQLRLIREKQGWEQEQVAEMAELKPVTVQKIEEGVFNVPIDVIERMCNVLGCSLGLCPTPNVDKK